MHLEKLLSILSKSSPYSVSTLETEAPERLLQAKEYLYIKTPIESDFENAVKSANKGDLLFLCGSSGDGKSEILTRLYRNVEFQNVVFHLDATHSKTQHGSAIDCLDKLFDDYSEEGFVLAIGINIGMMQKFIKLGAKRHQSIKYALQEFLSNRHMKSSRTGNASFYDFESYPRITFDEQGFSSYFISDFLKKLTKEDSHNPFWNAYLLDKQMGLIVSKNFELISRSSIQQAIITLMGIVRLHDEQFLVPRTFIDFIYKVICSNSPDGLVGNIFSVFDNPLSEKIQHHDPVKTRSEELDDYLLSKATGTLNNESRQCSEYLEQLAGVKLSDTGKLRLLSLLSDAFFINAI